MNRTFRQQCPYCYEIIQHEHVFYDTDHDDLSYTLFQKEVEEHLDTCRERHELPWYPVGEERLFHKE